MQILNHSRFISVFIELWQWIATLDSIALEFLTTEYYKLTINWLFS